MRYEILKHINAEQAPLLGEGIEAWVYQLPNNKTVRIYKSDTAFEQVKKLKDFYDSLDTSAATFTVPYSMSVNTYKGVVYTIDRQLQGAPLRTMLTADNRQSLLEAYIHLAESGIASLHAPYNYFGDILASNPLRCLSWPEFLRAKIQVAYKTATELFKADVPNIEKILDFINTESSFVSNITTAKLVHGDFNASNVLATANGITALTDFGDLTLAGDPRMDITSGIIGFMEEEDGMKKADGEFLLHHLETIYGPVIRQVIHLYRLYYAIHFASYCKESDPRTYNWCLQTFREHLADDYSY